MSYLCVIDCITKVSIIFLIYNTKRDNSVIFYERLYHRNPFLMKAIKFSILASVVFYMSCAVPQEEYYVKHVVFPVGATPELKLDMASRLVPADNQRRWQELELTAFLHFGINTFTGREWGDGTEDPALFDPTELDCRQWVETLRQGGFRLAILTAKHHDGFCLWPSATTDHSVESSAWKDRKGDVVREFREACEAEDVKFGIYLSPWDRNAGCYGDSDAYNAFFIAQLTELLTGYGTVDEVWFDGACGEGPNGKRQEYDWDAYFETVRRLQPDAVIAIMGDDVRWVGNEQGYGRETEWSATVMVPEAYSRARVLNGRLGIGPQSPDLGSREMVALAGELFWYPSEVDVSIRPGWFYHASEDGQVKSLEHLVKIYFESVGLNSGLLLNIPPDRRGLIAGPDAERLAQWSEYLTETFSVNAVTGRKTFSIKEGQSRDVKIRNGSNVNVIMLREDISRGQRVESFVLEAFAAGEWKEVGRGTTIGNKRLVRIPETEASKLRITITGSRGTANISEVGVFHAAPLR